RPMAPRIGMPAAFARMYDGTIADALAGTQTSRSRLSAISLFMFCASTAGSNTEERTVTLAPCFSRPLLTVLAQAAQNGFWFVQMMTPTFLPESDPFWPLAPSAPVTKTAAASASAASETQRKVLRLMLLRPFLRTIDERPESGDACRPWGESAFGG